MPRGDGTGPRGTGGCRRNDASGRPTGGVRMRLRGAGPSLEVICPQCGTKETREPGTPCFEQKCPKCGSAMIRA